MKIKEELITVIELIVFLIITFSGPTLFMNVMTALGVGKALTLFCILPASSLLTLAFAKLMDSSFEDELFKMSVWIGLSIVRYAPPLFMKLTMLLAASQAFALLGTVAVPVAISLILVPIIAALYMFGAGSEHGVSLIKSIFNRCFPNTGEEPSNAPENESQSAAIPLSSTKITQLLDARRARRNGLYENAPAFIEVSTQTEDDLSVESSQIVSANDDQVIDSNVLRN